MGWCSQLSMTALRLRTLFSAVSGTHVSWGAALARLRRAIGESPAIPSSSIVLVIIRSTDICSETRQTPLNILLNYSEHDRKCSQQPEHLLGC